MIEERERVLGHTLGENGLSVFRTLDDVDVAGKRVLVRADLNVPMEDARITDATRIDRVLANIDPALQGPAGHPCLLWPCSH